VLLIFGAVGKYCSEPHCDVFRGR